MTNNTFTKSAKELAGKTGVLLCDNTTIKEKNLIPAFKIPPMSILGIIVLTISILCFWIMIGNPNIKYKLLQIATILFFACGGVLNIIEFGIWKLEAAATIFYFIANILSAVTSIALKSDSSIIDPLCLIPATISAIRMFILWWKTKKSAIQYQKLINNCGAVYIDILSSKLNSKISLVKAVKTEYGFYFIYHSSEVTAGKLYNLQIEFNSNLEDNYEFRSMNDNDFEVKVYERETDYKTLSCSNNN